MKITNIIKIILIVMSLMILSSLSILAKTCAIQDKVRKRTLKIIREYEILVTKGSPSVALVPALMSFWGATNWQVINSSDFQYSENPDNITIKSDNRGMHRKYYELTWNSPKSNKIVVKQTLDVELTCINTLYTNAKLPYSDEVKKRFAESLVPDEKKEINPNIPQFAPICDEIIKKSDYAEEVVELVCDWINENISFKSKQKSVQIALAQQKGNCTAMSKIACAMLRKIGIPTEVVSGKFIGSDGGHDFIEVYFPDAGWVFYDPSNISRGF
ncbi:MAG: transglutaminase domain-containing protein [Spirochaetes bacterium]|nr:transglutaminase domain-containing protein [Spirochaetota bacterium]